MPREAIGDASLAIDVARGVDSTGGDRPREAPGEDESGTGRGLEGDDVFLWPDIEPEYIALPEHALFSSAKVELGLHSTLYGDYERCVSVFVPAGGFPANAIESWVTRASQMCVTRSGDDTVGGSGYARNPAIGPKR